MAVSNADLSAQLTDLLKEVQAIRQENAAREEREKGIKEKVDRHDAILEGNGKEGLKTTVAKLQDSLASWSVKANIIAGLVGAQLVALIFGILTHTISFNP